MFSKFVSLSLALGLALPFAGLAQKPDREKLGYFNYTQPPASGDLSGKEFYLLEVELDGSDAYRRQIAQQHFKVNGFLQADADNPVDFTINIREGAFSFGTPKKSSYTREGKTYHYYKSDGRFHYTIKVLNQGEEEIFRDDATGSRTVKGDNSESLSLANEYHTKAKAQFKEEVMLEQLDVLARMFQDQYSNVEQTIHLNAIRIKERKHDYPEFNKAFDDLNRAYEILKVSNEPTDESEELLESIISTYTSFVADATPDKKKSKKDADVTAAAYYNLGVAQFLARDFEGAKNSLSKAASYDDRVMHDVEYLMKESQSMAERTGLKFYEP